MNEAFEKVVREQSGRLYALCFRLTGQAEEAEDLLHDTFLSALKGFERFEGRAQVSTWLHRIALNVWKNRLRTKSRRPLLQWLGLHRSGDDEQETIDPVGPDPTPDIALEKSESSDLLQQALLKLDPSEREVVVLRDLNELSYEEIASLLNVPVGTIKSRLSRARESLRSRLVPLLKKRGEWRE